MAKEKREIKVKISKAGKEGIEVDLEGFRHTIPNLIRQELWNDKNVSYAAYTKPHPYIGNAKIMVRGKDPKKSLEAAVKRAEEEIKKFEKDFARAAK